LKKRRFVMMACAVMALIMAVTGCSGTPSEPSGSSSVENNPAEPAEIIVAQGVDVAQLDGHSPGGVPKCNIDFAIHQPLLTRDANGELTGALATEWTAVDDRTWEFKLREGVKFQNGETLNAETIKANIERIINPPAGLSTYGYIAGVTGAEVVDDLTVRIISGNPMPTLPDSLPLLSMLPMSEMNRSLEEVATRPVGAGPFQFVEWVKDDHLTLQAFPDFWKGTPKIDTVKFVPITEDDVRVSALLTGDVDIITNVPVSALDQLKSSPDVEVYTAEGPRVIYVGMNTEKEGPLQNVKVRQALNMAIDKDSIFEYILGGTGSSYGQPVGKTMTGYNPSVEPYAYDEEAAKALLAEAGYPDGFTVTFNCSPGRFSMDKEIAEAIASQLGKIGVNAEIKTMDWSTFSKARTSRELDGLFLTSLGYGSYDGYSVLYDGLRTGANFSFYTNKTLDGMIEDIAATTDLDSREKKLQDAMKFVHDDAAWLFLGSVDTIFAARKDVKDYRAIIEYLWLGDASVEK